MEGALLDQTLLLLLSDSVTYYLASVISACRPSTLQASTSATAKALRTSSRTHMASTSANSSFGSLLGRSMAIMAWELVPTR